MKHYFLIIVVVFISQFGFTQENKMATNAITEDNLIYDSKGLEKKPDYPGGLNAFYSFISKTYKVPNVKGLKGKVIVMFVIEKDGSLTDIKVLKDIGYGTGDEAIRVLKICEKWTPGEQNGKKVRVKYALPIALQN